MKRLTRTLPLILAALLQLLPLVRNIVTNPAVANSFAFILRWGIGAGAVLGSVDAVSGATSVFTTPSTFSGTVGTAFNNNVTVSIGGGNQAASSDYFVVSSGSTSSSTLSSGSSTTVTLPPGLSFTASWVNGASTIGGYISGTPTTAGTYSTTVTCVSPGNAQLSQAITITITGTTTPTAPAITTPPAAASVAAGKNATFTVTASGTAPLGYFWLKNGAPLANAGNVSGANTATLTLAAVAATDAANYSVLVSNSVGTATSAAAALTVILPPAITGQPAAQTQPVGASASFSVTATGSAPLIYRWLKNSAAIANGTKYSGVSSNVLTVAALATADAGNFSVIITNLAGSVTSSVAPLTVVSSPTITTPPANVAVVAGGSASFTVTAAGSAPLGYFWLKNGSPLANAGNISGATAATLNISTVATADAGSYSVIVSNSLGTATSAGATLTVAVPPAITTSPASATLLAGSNVSFTVAASGTAPLNFQWLKNGAAIAGATAATLTLANVSAADAANYSATVTNAVGTATSGTATLTVLVPPSITSPPAGTNVLLGNPAVFSATAGGTAPLNFQWLKNGVAISGATSNVLTLSAVTTNDAGNYSVVVTNTVGSIASSSAALAVLVPPAIVTQPTAASVVAGNSASFTVTASGTAPLTYQWLKNGAAISSATSATLTLTKVSTNDAAAYSVVVANAAGSATSGSAVLTVQLPPSIVTQPASQFGALGSTINLSVTAGGTGPLSYQWFMAGAPLTDGGNISGSATSVLTITALTTNEVNNYFVVVSSAYGTATSASVNVAVNVAPIITVPPASQNVAVSNTVVLTVVANGSGPLAYQWLKNGVKLANGGKFSGVTTPSLTLTSVATNNSGSYTVTVTNIYGRVTSAAATLSVLIPPGIAPATRITTPATRLAKAGTNTTFTVTATGSKPFSYQWFKNGAALVDNGRISGATTAALKVSLLTTSDTASYFVVVSNPVGSMTNGSALLTVFVPPAITTQPASQPGIAGSSVSFGLTVTGTAPLHYQWLKNTKVIAGATNSTFVIASVKTNDAAAYAVVVTNFAGSVTSSNAALTVWVAPVFTAQAASRTGTNTLTTIFKAAAKGTGPLGYQWFKNGRPLIDGGNISGSFSNILTVTNLRTNDSGAYFLTVSNFAGSITSSNATLVVTRKRQNNDNIVVAPGNNVVALQSQVSIAPILPPVIAGIVRNPDSSITLNCSGTAGSNYVVQVSADLANWTSLAATNTADASGQWQVNDAAAATLPARFYRLATP